MRSRKKTFGGSWTAEKLACVRDYLIGFNLALRNQSFERVYIDAFAGTGYVELRQEDKHRQYSFLEVTESEAEAEAFLKGSALQALEVDPPFHRFIFIEKSPRRAKELQQLQASHPHRRIETLKGDANVRLTGLCSERWQGRRAVCFLDPFGMAVSWDTLEVIAETHSIDVWYLFPLMGVTRLLRNDGDIGAPLRKRLTKLFGANDWEDHFYSTFTQGSLFGDDVELIQKTAGVKRIRAYFLERLRTLFPAVARNPKLLCNARGTPLFLLFFAASNPSPKAKRLALRIAENVLGSS
jgi:three-Cys-motif partner protein